MYRLNYVLKCFSRLGLFRTVTLLFHIVDQAKSINPPKNTQTITIARTTLKLSNASIRSSIFVVQLFACPNAFRTVSQRELCVYKNINRVFLSLS